MANKQENVGDDCCGNGCAHCVLDAKPVRMPVTLEYSKINVLNTYSWFQLLEKRKVGCVTDHVYEMHFKSLLKTVDNYILYIKPGHHLMMRIQQSEPGDDNEKSTYLFRPYSPFWWSSVDLEFKILVNLAQRGPMTRFLYNLDNFNSVEFRGPIGNYEQEIDTQGTKRLMLITQGVAIAPAIPIIKEILTNEDDLTRITHLACFPHLEAIYFRQDLMEFSKYWNYKIHTFLSRQLCPNAQCVAIGHCSEKCVEFTRHLKYKELIDSINVC